MVEEAGLLLVGRFGEYWRSLLPEILRLKKQLISDKDHLGHRYWPVCPSEIEPFGRWAIGRKLTTCTRR